MKEEFATYLVRLGERIRALRIQKGVDQKQFAFDCGLGRTVLHTIEKGTANPSVKTLMRIAYGLDMSVSELMKLD